MNIFISVDIEGITGINNWKQCNPGNEDYQRARKLMTREINAAIAGAKEGGATNFLVNDAHGPMTNILIEDLDPDARLISGSNKKLCQMEGIEKDFEGAFFIGYHAGDGNSDGTLNHTVLSNTVYEIKCNGKVVDEAAINAGIAGYFNVPVLFLAGDDITCTSAKERFKNIITAETKKAVDRLTINSYGLQKSHENIKSKAREAVKGIKSIFPYSVSSPVEFEVSFKVTSPANMSQLFPQFKRIGSKTVKITENDYLLAYKQLWGLLIFARAVENGIL